MLKPATFFFESQRNSDLHVVVVTVESRYPCTVGHPSIFLVDAPCLLEGCPLLYCWQNHFLINLRIDSLSCWFNPHLIDYFLEGNTSTFLGCSDFHFDPFFGVRNQSSGMNINFYTCHREKTRRPMAAIRCAAGVEWYGDGRLRCWRGVQGL